MSCYITCYSIIWFVSALSLSLSLLILCPGDVHRAWRGPEIRPASLLSISCHTIWYDVIWYDIISYHIITYYNSRIHIYIYIHTYTYRERDMIVDCVILCCSINLNYKLQRGTANLRTQILDFRGSDPGPGGARRSGQPPCWEVMVIRGHSQVIIYNKVKVDVSNSKAD